MALNEHSKSRLTVNQPPRDNFLIGGPTAQPDSPWQDWGLTTQPVTTIKPISEWGNVTTKGGKVVKNGHVFLDDLGRAMRENKRFFNNPRYGHGFSGGSYRGNALAYFLTQQAKSMPPKSGAHRNSAAPSGDYGSRINLPPTSIRTMDFIDRDRDRIDDRYQSGPGQPRGGGTVPDVPAKPAPPPPPTTPNPLPQPPTPPSGISWQRNNKRRGRSAELRSV